VYKVRSIEDGNKLLHLLVPEAGPLLSRCDFINWGDHTATIVEVVKHGKDNEKNLGTTPDSAQTPILDNATKKSIAQKRHYWRDLKRKENQKGGYHDLEIPGKLEYRREDMGSPLSLWRIMCGVRNTRRFVSLLSLICQGLCRRLAAAFGPTAARTYWGNRDAP
jgi:hypothetical protein